MQRGAVAPAQLLDAGQERVLWEEQLAAVAGDSGEDATLAVHAGALMSAAARATQSRLVLHAVAQTREERLLVEALKAVRATCATRGLLSLRLAPAESLDFLAGSRAPLFVGIAQPSAQQELLQRRFWPGESVLAPPPAATATNPALIRAGDPQHEIAACAAWCLGHLERNPAARLLVLTAAAEPSPGIQAQQLWQALSAGDDLRRCWLAEEGGDSLAHLGLVADALLALAQAEQEQGLELAGLLALLRSPYFHFGTRGECSRLAAWLEGAGLARMEATALHRALQSAASAHPAAARLSQWLTAMGAGPGHTQRLGTTEWAGRFTAVLAEAGFASSQPLDAREQQVLVRWHALLDEFAALDAVLAPLRGADALARLRRQAAQARHIPVPADAAISFSDRLIDPVAGFDGIWVMGMSESRWPAAPRPDPWVPLSEQRRARWPEASVGERRRQAQWALECWQRRTPDLVLSHAMREADIHHRPTTLVAGDWIDAAPAAGASLAVPQAVRATDGQLPGLAAEELAAPLGGGAARLDTQQACAFRAQARWRLGAEPAATLADGIPAWLRGRLLHSLLDDLWQRLQDQSRLLALDAATQEQMLQQSWRAALGATREAAWLPHNVLERERARTLRLVAQVLELERQRAPFAVMHRERVAQWQGAGARLGLRIDRIDEAAGEAILIDYKSGAPPGIRLQHGELRPLQLALYADTLAQQGRSVAAAALLNLHPRKPSFAGVVAQAGLLPGKLHAADDWSQLAQAWRAELQRLMAEHIAGTAMLARDRKACQGCHLPALCRRAGADAADDAAVEEADE